MGAIPGDRSELMNPPENHGPKILSPTSPRTPVRLGCPDAADPVGVERDTEPENARNGRGCALMPASALVTFRTPSCSANPLTTPIGVTRSSRPLAPL